MWQWLGSRRFTNYKFRRQQPIGPYVLDFFCPEAKLSIELDGNQHGILPQKTVMRIAPDFLPVQE
jgi:very-short-patch-repair endonuclease